MRLQNHTLPNRELVLEFHGKTISTDEEHVSDTINIATEELAGHGKGISNNPLTLLVRKNGVPDLTMIDLLGITCVPVHGQPENIYDQIKDMIMEYIKPEESIILNVLAAIVDFTTCESIRMSQSVDKKMHCTARLVEMPDSYSHDLYTCAESDVTKKFLIKEIKVLEEAKLIGFPNFMRRTAFLSILQGKVKGITKMPIGFVENVWNYLEDVLMNVLNCHSENYYQLMMFTRRAGQVLIAKKKQSSIKHVLAIEMEKHTDYTCNPEFNQEYNRLISLQEIFVNEVLNNEQKPTHVNLEGVGNIDVGHLRQYPSVLTLAFDLKVRMKSYWKIVQKRFIDTISLHLMLSINNIVDHDLEMDMVHDMLSPSGGGIERLLEESPSISGEREKLQRSAKIPKARTLSQTSLFFMTQHVNSILGTYFLIPLNQATYDAPSNYFLLANRAFWEEPVVLISSMKR